MYIFWNSQSLNLKYFYRYPLRLATVLLAPQFSRARRSVFWIWQWHAIYHRGEQWRQQWHKMLIIRSYSIQFLQNCPQCKSFHSSSHSGNHKKGGMSTHLKLTFVNPFFFKGTFPRGTCSQSNKISSYSKICIFHIQHWLLFRYWRKELFEEGDKKV